MTVKNALAGIAVRDFAKAIEWYGKLLGRKPDSRPMPDLAEWKFSTGGWIQLFQDANRAGRSSVTLVETDFDRRLSDLKDGNYHPGSVTRSETVNVAIIHDPDGNQIVFAQGGDQKNRPLG
jgi:catechol 2,3-dioxygenase-like lactoylglutathione lyase family enzyme